MLIILPCRLSVLGPLLEKVIWSNSCSLDSGLTRSVWGMQPLHTVYRVSLKGFAPCRRPLNSGFDDTTIRCFHGLLTASHLSPTGGSRACLLMSILIPFEVHFGCWRWPWTSCWRPLEMPRAWPGSRTGPGTPEWAGLHSRPGGSIVLPGSRDPGNGPGRWWIWRFCALLSIKQLPDSKNFHLRTAWLETQEGNCWTFDWTAPSQPGGTL